MRALPSVVLALGLAHGIATAQVAMPDLRTPAEPIGRKSERGIVVSSVPDGFEIELAGQRIEPLSQDRLQWTIDGRRVELLVVRRRATGPWSAEDAMRDLEA